MLALDWMIFQDFLLHVPQQLQLFFWTKAQWKKEHKLVFTIQSVAVMGLFLWYRYETTGRKPSNFQAVPGEGRQYKNQPSMVLWREVGFYNAWKKPYAVRHWFSQDADLSWFIILLLFSWCSAIISILKMVLPFLSLKSISHRDMLL
jgi:hypothetical protein